MRHQSADGSWDAASPGRHCTDANCAIGIGSADVVADTSLALMAIGATGWGAPRVRAFHDGLSYLQSVQLADGSFQTSSAAHRVLGQALATEALCRSLGEKSDVAHRDAAKRAAAYLLSLRQPGSAWGDGVGEAPSELRVTTWATMALADARLTNLRIPNDVYRDVLAWIDTEPGGRTVAAAAMRTCCRLSCGTNLRDPHLVADLEILKRDDASGADEGSALDAAEEYFATVAEFYWGGDVWRDRRSLHLPVLLRRQRGQEQGCRLGSWGASGTSSAHAGDIGSTALTSMLFDCAYISTYRNSGGFWNTPLIPK